MSYAIGSVVSGCPIPDKLAEFVQDVGDDAILDSIGFEGLYSASGCNPIGYCGVLVKKITECADVDLLRTSFFPTEQQKVEAKEKLSKAREACGNYSRTTTRTR